MMSMPPPNGPGEVVLIDYFGPLRVTANGNGHTLLVPIASAGTPLYMQFQALTS